MNRIKELRTDKGLTLVELATLSGVSRSSLSAYENGTREPKSDKWLMLADALGVSVPYLQGISKDRSPENIFGSMNDLGNNELNRSLRYLSKSDALPFELNMALASLINSMLEIASLENRDLNIMVQSVVDDIGNYVHGAPADILDSPSELFTSLIGLLDELKSHLWDVRNTESIIPEFKLSSILDFAKRNHVTDPSELVSIIKKSSKTPDADIAALKKITQQNVNDSGIQN